MKLTKVTFLLGALGMVLFCEPEAQADTCGCPSKQPCVTAKPVCVKSKKDCCKPGLANRIASGTAMIFEGTGDAIGWTFRRIGDIF